jgi:hypothetical protein
MLMLVQSWFADNWRGICTLIIFGAYYIAYLVRHHGEDRPVPPRRASLYLRLLTPRNLAQQAILVAVVVFIWIVFALVSR